jgi:predicted lysophospholipase L1 biosynthesis ABC-type transport system permease subunit
VAGPVLAVLFAVFAGLALVLATGGLYAVLAYTVSMRTHEIGIRMALGASAAQVRSMVMRQGIMLAGVGLVVGIVAASATTRLLKSQLYQVSPDGVQTYAAVVALMSARRSGCFLLAITPCRAGSTDGCSRVRNNARTRGASLHRTVTILANATLARERQTFCEPRAILFVLLNRAVFIFGRRCPEQGHVPR